MPPRRRPAWGRWLATLGPGVLGLAADNDAGGMLSYLMTGGAGHLLVYVGALAVTGPLTYLMQEIALRVGLAAGKPYAAVLADRFGWTVARLSGILLHALNFLVLVTEFVGMASALALFGVPIAAGAGMGLGLVLLCTLSRRYLATERLLLWASLGSLAFIPAFWLMHPRPPVLTHYALAGSPGTVPFLLLALAGNSAAPWMIYWQENAIVAGSVHTLREGRRDIRLGLFGQVFMAALAMALGALLGLGPHHWANPLQWIGQTAPRAVTALVALGIFDAGFLAASTISLASTWMLRQAFWGGEAGWAAQPTRGSGAIIQMATLCGAAAVVALPHLPLGMIALWAQAASALFMAPSLLLLGLVAKSRRIMGRYRLHRVRTALLAVSVALFAVLAVLAI